MLSFDLTHIEAMPKSKTLSDRLSIAHKQHECYICPRPIEIGERYQRIVQTTEGHFEVLKLHKDNCYDDIE